MSSSSPDDLAVAFRSITRRLREAGGDAPIEAAVDAVADVRGHLDEAARLMGTLPDPAAIADAIAAVKPDRWDDAVLDRLRSIALEVGQLLRHIQTLTDG